MKIQFRRLLFLLSALILVGQAAQTPPNTLSEPHTAMSKPDADGFIKRWLLLEPIDNASGLTDTRVQESIHKEYFPDQFSLVPPDGSQVTVNGASLVWHAVDTNKYNINLFHFGRALNKKTSNVLFWAVTVIQSPRDMHDVRLAIGSNAASVWWLNGQEVVGIYGDRQTVIDDGVSKRLTLKSGPNVLRAAIVNGGGATDFCARFLDADDKPVSAFVITLPKSSSHQGNQK
jgi:hypothetical protein